MKNEFGVEDAKLYGFLPTRDGRWMVGHVSDGKWTKHADLYESEVQAKEIAELLNARERQRYEAEMAALK